MRIGDVTRQRWLGIASAGECERREMGLSVKRENEKLTLKLCDVQHSITPCSIPNYYPPFQIIDRLTFFISNLTTLLIQKFIQNIASFIVGRFINTKSSRMT